MLELERFLPYRLSLLSNTISAAIARTYQNRFGLSVTQWRILAVLGRYSGISANEVAEHTAMDKVAVSRAIAELLKNKHIKRTIHSNDRRRSVLALSAKGRKLYGKIAPLALQHEQALLSQLSASERVHLDRILTKLTGFETS